MMSPEDTPPCKIVTLMQDADGHLEIVADDDVSKFEALGMIQTAYSRQWMDVYDEEVDNDVEWVDDDDP